MWLHRLTKMSGRTAGVPWVGQIRMAEMSRHFPDFLQNKQRLERRLPQSALGDGTDRALPPRGPRQRRSLRSHTLGRMGSSFHQWSLFVLCALLQTTCVVLPPTADPVAEVPPSLHIATADPLPFRKVTVADPLKGQDFRITVTQHGLDPQSLHYAWYFDWLPDQPNLDFSQVCGSKSTCTVSLCGRNAQQVDHTLLAVVSSVPLAEGAATPTVFPAEAVFDAIEWRIHRTADCPKL